MFPSNYHPPDFLPGSVWLAGAGPGDAGLLTLHAVHALSQADVIVHDALVSAEVLSMAREGVELIHAGKRGGRPSPKQADISLRLVQLARQGKRVLRLKGGDPFVFGRGGEEALALVKAGIPFRVIPGITAGIGGLSHAGIPVTHRDTNHAVTFVTGHDATGAMTGMDWDALAKGAPAIVIYMALKHLSVIAEALVAGGRPADEPVAIVSWASTGDQRVLETTLATCAHDAATSGMPAPAIVAVGEIVRLRAGLDWLGAETGRVLEADPLHRSRRNGTG